MNKIGIHYGAFVKNWLEDQIPLIERVKLLGFDVLEFGVAFLLSLDSEQRRIMKEEAARHGIKLVCSIGLDLAQDVSSTDPALRRSGIDFMINAAQALGEMEISDCSGIFYAAWNGKIKDYSEKAGRWELSVKALQEAAKAFEDNDVFFNVEVVNRFESFMINTCAEAKQYIRDVASPRLGILLDTFHMNIEEDSPVKAIKLAGTDLRYFHLGENNRKFPGMGTMPWKIIFDSLKVIDYQGPVTMEPFTIPGGEVGSAVSLYRELLDTAEFTENVKRSLAFVKALL